MHIRRPFENYRRISLKMLLTKVLIAFKDYILKKGGRVLIEDDSDAK